MHTFNKSGIRKKNVLDKLKTKKQVKQFYTKLRQINELSDYLKTLENKVYNPKELEYWRNIFPTKTDDELEEYRVKWSKENLNYLKFKKL